MMTRVLALMLLVATLAVAPLVMLAGTSAVAQPAGAAAVVSLDHCAHASKDIPPGDEEGQADLGCATMCAVQGTEPALPELAVPPQPTTHAEWQQANLGCATEQEPPPPR